MKPPWWLAFLLLLVLVCATCATLSTQPPRPLPPLPSSAPTKHGPIPIRFVDGLRCLGGPAYGCFHTHPYKIEIDSTELTRDGQWFVLFHELFHVATYTSGLAFKDSADADSLANAVARQRLREMRAGWPR